MHYYAELDENNICKAVSDLSGKVDKPTIIPIDFYDVSLLGKQYNNGKWLEVEQPETVYEPTEQEIIQAEILLNQAKIMAKLNQLEV
ncbi:MAG: flagellar basal-body rod protein [Peptococcaceae bacterium]|nr:flagellar basal-body rod protein [Peptococcaceae bacterium]